MADVRKHVEKVYTESITYTLTLSAEEAEAVAAILGRVAGDSEHSSRKYVESVRNALERSGVRWFGRSIANSMSGVIRVDGEA